MKRSFLKLITRSVFVAAAVLLTGEIADAQIQAAGGGYYVAGYGRVYGSFGQASLAQSRLYDKIKAQKAERRATSESSESSNRKMADAPPRVARNYGVFRPDPTIDTGALLADNLGSTPEEKALIKQIYTATKAEYEKESAARGFKNNIAGGLTFFTISAATVYHGREDELNDDAANLYFKITNAALDEMPEFANVSDKDKQGFNNMLVGFSGLILMTYLEGKQTGDAAMLASSKKLAGTLMELVLKTDPENIRFENGLVVIK